MITLAVELHAKSHWPARLCSSSNLVELESHESFNQCRFSGRLMSDNNNSRCVEGLVILLRKPRGTNNTFCESHSNHTISADINSASLYMRLTCARTCSWLYASYRTCLLESADRSPVSAPKTADLKEGLSN